MAQCPKNILKTENTPQKSKPTTDKDLQETAFHQNCKGWAWYAGDTDQWAKHLLGMSLDPHTTIS